MPALPLPLLAEVARHHGDVRAVIAHSLGATAAAMSHAWRRLMTSEGLGHRRSGRVALQPDRRTARRSRHDASRFGTKLVRAVTGKTGLLRRVGKVMHIGRRATTTCIVLNEG